MPFYASNQLKRRGETGCQGFFLGSVKNGYHCTTLTFRLDTGWIKVLGFLIACFLMGKMRSLSLLTVGRKRTEMSCALVLREESMFGVTLCFSVITDRKEHGLTE